MPSWLRRRGRGAERRLADGRRRAYGRLTGLALLALVSVGAAWLGAHEGHGTATERPVYRQVQAGGETYRVGFAMQPRDALTGEDVRLEFQFLRQAAGEPAGGTTPVDAGDLQVRIISTGGAPQTVSYVTAGDRPGTYLARYRFSAGGEYAVSVRLLAAGATIGADFPVLVGAGPVPRAALVIDAIVLLLLGAFAFSRWQRRAARAQEGGSSPMAADAALAAAGLAILVIGHVWVSPRVGRLFLPERHPGTIAWDQVSPADGAGNEPAAPAVEPHTHPEGTPPHSHPAPTPPSGAKQPPPQPAGIGEIVSTVVPVPGALAEVVVPVTARVLFEAAPPRVGRAVKRGQTLAVLEHHYVLHDANHLINQRWPFLVDVLEKRRSTLRAELDAARLRHLYETSEPAVQRTMRVMQAVPNAELAVAAARLEQQRAEKLLALHDKQITKKELVQRPIASPIDGIVEAVHFTQGELKYENDKLFTILDLSRVWIEVRFPERFASAAPPQSMTFWSPAFPDRRFEGRLARVANTLDQRTGTAAVFYEVANPQRLLRVGMRLSAQHEADDLPRAIATTSPAKPPSPGIRPAAAVMLPPVSLAATVKPRPEFTAEVTAPLWGRLEFAGRRLNVGDRVRKGEDLVHVVLELSADERYPMEARMLEIEAERQLAEARLAQAEAQWRRSVEQLKENPDDGFLQEEVKLTERLRREAQQEVALLRRQAEVFKDVMKRRDPKITVVQAPISGVVTEVNFRPGELNPTDEFRRLLTIVDTSRVWLEAPVYPHQSGVLLNGFSRATYTSPGLPSPRPLDKPVALSGVVNPETGALTAIFDVPNPGGALKVGASAQILIERN